jgi:hypothetical protein
MPTRTEVEDALIGKYGRDLEQNPRWDRKKAKANDWADDPENPELVPVTREQNVNSGPWVVFKDSDKHNSLRVASIAEIVDVLVEAGLVQS